MQRYTYAPGSNRLTSVSSNTSYAYNADGSPSTYSGLNLTYGDFGRLGRATSSDGTGPVVSFFYNGLGQRVVKSSRVWIASGGGMAAVSPFGTAGAQTAGGTAQSSGFWSTTSTDRFFYDDAGRLLGEYDSTTNYTQETVRFDGQPVAAGRRSRLPYSSGGRIFPLCRRFLRHLLRKRVP